MAPTVILIRHAQALHNVAHKSPSKLSSPSQTNTIPRDYSLPDPALTDLGYGPQCRELAQYLQKSLPIAQEISLIVVSPMRRTLQTAQQSLGWLMRRGIPVVLRAEWQENSSKPCDTGSPISVMQEEWPQFDWSAVDPAFPSKEGLYEYSKQGLRERGIVARKWLKGRPERVIAVVSHSGFLRVGVSKRKYENADFRVFEFEEGDEHDDVGGNLVEWELTEKKGGGLGKSPKGIWDADSGDYPAEKENDLGEVVGEKPS